MKLTKIQMTTRFIVYTLLYVSILGTLTGLLPAMILGKTFQVLGL